MAVFEPALGVALLHSHPSAISEIDLTGWIPVSDTWTYASVDDPTFTITVPSGATSKYAVGMRVKLTQTTVKYFIITAVADTVLTVYGGTDYDVADAAISLIYVSNVKSPLGFPINPIKWTVSYSDTALQTTATPTQNVWYNTGSGSLAIPIGSWDVDYFMIGRIDEGTATNLDLSATLSTANNSESDVDFTAGLGMSLNSVVTMPLTRRKHLLLDSKTTYYLNIRTINAGVDNIRIRGDYGKTFIRAICSYL